MLSDRVVIPASLELMCQKEDGDAPGVSLAPQQSSHVILQVNKWRGPEVVRVQLKLRILTEQAW